MGWKKLIFGEKMPDRDDPKYAERYKKEVEAGKKAARFLRIDKMAGCAQRRIDKMAGCAQRFACKHPRWFLGIVFGIVLGCLALNVCRVVSVCSLQDNVKHTTATERQEILLKQKQPTHDDDGQD